MSDAFDFRGWLAATGYNQTEAATALNVSQDYVSMLAADPASPRFRPTSKKIRSKCAEVAAQRIREYGDKIAQLSRFAAGEGGS